MLSQLADFARAGCLLHLATAGIGTSLGSVGAAFCRYLLIFFDLFGFEFHDLFRFVLIEFNVFFWFFLGFP
jgi:hypothetical protein